MFILAFLSFVVAAVIAILGVHGITLSVVTGIIAIGLAFLSLAVGGVWDTWPGMHFRRRVP